MLLYASLVTAAFCTWAASRIDLNEHPEVFINFRELTLPHSTLTSLIYFLAILRKFILAN